MNGFNNPNFIPEIVERQSIEIKNNIPIPTISFFCSSWGQSVSFDEFCEMAVDAGFDGVETGIPADDKKSAELIETLRKHNLTYIFQCNLSGEDFDEYLTAYRRELERAAELKPVLINSHTGKDHFCRAKNEILIAAAESISQSTGVCIVHETHRGRFAFAAHVTREYLDRLPTLQLALDISHWCVVHETLLEDQSEAVSLALQRTAHIHARVGHSQGPQVNDPRAPEWQQNLQQHLIWWDFVVAQRQKQQKRLTITTEFGPPNYLPTLPYTQQPLADQWQINTYMLELLRSRYGRTSSRINPSGV